MNAKDLIKTVEKRGWKYISTNGSHRKYKHPKSKWPIVIPFHSGKDLSPGALHQIEKMLEQVED